MARGSCHATMVGGVTTCTSVRGAACNAASRAAQWMAASDEWDPSAPTAIPSVMVSVPSPTADTADVRTWVVTAPGSKDPRGGVLWRHWCEEACHAGNASRAHADGPQ